MTGRFLSVPSYDWCPNIHLPVCLWIMHPHSRVAKKSMSHGNEVLPQVTTHLTQRPCEVLPQVMTHLIQRPCYQLGSLYRDPAGNQTTWRPSDHRKEMQTEDIWTCLLFIRSGKNYLARHSEREKKRQTEEEVGRQRQGMDRPGGR